MKKLCLVCLVLVYCPGRVAADTFVRSRVNFFSNPNGPNRTKSVEFSGLPDADSNVTVLMTVHGDFASNANYFLGSFGSTGISSSTVTPWPTGYQVPANGRLLEFGGITACSCCVYNAIRFTIPKVGFNTELSPNSW